MEIHQFTIAQLAAQLAARKLSSREATEAVLARIEATGEQVNAYITVDREGALADAEAADRRLAAGEAPTLCGVPIAVKDLLCTKGLRTTGGSKILENFVPPYSATAVEKLREAGAVLVGKTTLDEFAMGSSNEHCPLAVPHNPWNLDHICGGSSGGSAAAVAADQCMGALGTDTGGSIRQPASHCGVVGVKPTYGRVSRYGVLAFASSLDQVGPLTKDVRDAALLLNAICGHDPRDSTSVREPVADFSAELGRPLAGLRFGLPREYFEVGLDEDVKKAVMTAVNRLQEAGAEIREISLPRTEYGVAAYYLIAPAEASSNLSRYDGVRYGYRDQEARELLDLYRRSRSRGFGREVKRRIIIGTYALSSGYYEAYYGKASQVRALIIDDFRRAFEECDLIISPVTPTPAWPLGDKSDPLSMYLTDILTIPTNLAGLPGMSLPCGFSSKGLPIGLQLQAPHFREDLLLRAAAAIEEQQGPADRRPQL
ncbi:Asp-tRNA(Asn)/Glu-tRNA(Gln) amidotransferase subunit GatA [Desulfurivibrio alkaliphilus]|uniref:Glutamyl-tRNA(Gln) amidotransferase subunit A n=1 Tax=Desulfurivibrio alkaliphilus (strain DSM 19089 / UNIQEM U267 / AHT2) TaxID=589865 RepID=D6Z1J6_DESAT|nr:Asp-tRNA(Asn)/Glu-tRNA(Gln) amidotransferase subunit GatA [Desulfurivibrio alkaliphilus]ADH87330.1 glutamyl-tRNA(Gln) amidotransferase, A subunit [Desulfurivibrio alkaliphilus AHT 2]